MKTLRYVTIENGLITCKGEFLTDEKIDLANNQKEISKELFDKLKLLPAQMATNTEGIIIDVEEKAFPIRLTETELLQQDVGALLLESAADKAKIADLETLTGELLLEIATLKGGAA